MITYRQQDYLSAKQPERQQATALIVEVNGTELQLIVDDAGRLQIALYQDAYRVPVAMSSGGVNVLLVGTADRRIFKP